MSVLRAVRRRVRAGEGEGDGGIALITVVIVLAVMFSFSLVMLGQVINDAKGARKDQDYAAALGAAQAGIDEYISRLNVNAGYYVYTTASPDASNPAMGFTGGKPNWAPVPTAAGTTTRASFHYDVDNATYTGTSTVAANGNLVVTSTGLVGKRTRTLQAQVRRSGFLDFVYFTNYETQDPSDYGGSSSCANYYNARPGGCTNIQFANDTIDGPVHSNDLMLVCNGVTFKSTVTYSTTNTTGNGLGYRTNSCASTSPAPVFSAGPPTFVQNVSMPLTNSSLISETSASRNPRGCLYVGPTKIVIKGTQVYVTSPWTRTPTPGCTTNAWMTIPANGTIYVDDVPSAGAGDINSWPAGTPGKPVCPNATSNNVGYPAAGEVGWSKYTCDQGDVFVEEQGGLAANALTGRLTLGASNNIYVTNNIDYDQGAAGNSFLGLIADNFVYVWHPLSSTTNNSGLGTNLNLPGQSTPFMNARIAASMLSVQHAVTVMNYQYGADLGTLNLLGSLTQQFRGIVRQNSSGYAKAYVYDKRLRYDAPPHFLSPQSSGFVNARGVEISHAYVVN